MGAGPRVKADTPFRNDWPNTPDFTFNFPYMMGLGGGAPIGTAPSSNMPKIAIIGGGVAGLTCMRELRRCGYGDIDLFEATSRIGGRNSSYATGLPSVSGNFTAYELGAMRFPLFNGNSVMKHYFDQFKITTQAFPDPGTVDTGIWLNQGRGASGARPNIDIDLWKASDQQPPADFTSVWKKWEAFNKLVTDEQYGMPHAYALGEEAWQAWWLSFANYYRERNFLEIALTPAKPKDPSTVTEPYFGGLGMTAEEARLFYTIGAGDGSWGAFFALSCLYPIRTLLCGFGEDHQLVQGRFINGQFDERAPEYGKESFDSLFQKFRGPYYIGIQSLAESLFYTPMATNDGSAESLYAQLNRSSAPELTNGLNLFISSNVSVFKRKGSLIELTSVIRGRDFTADYDIVICTPTTWAVQTSLPSVFEELPSYFWDAYHSSHWITSCKVFYPLKEKYWAKAGNKIPQIIVSDTALQDSYGYSCDVPAGTKDPGVLLLSYTWEDDAIKLLADVGQDASFGSRMLSELNKITTSAASIQQSITDYVVADTPIIQHWTSEPYYRGCAKLYHPGNEFENYNLLKHNQTNGKGTNLYLAGEGTSVYGGWTEPALRHALDAVVNIVNDTGGTFKEGFSFSDYPQYSSNNPYEEKAVPWAPVPQ